ncbi:hypothetical protein TrVFT333_011123 [Trichoderma virens FT-333]|nr:hypothetical protein TrVFT333_011123 [Trichoderma virens FT-333]
MAPRRTAQAPVPAPTSNRPLRVNKKKRKKSKARKAFERADREERRRQIQADYARLPNGEELEQPEAADFMGRSRLPNPKYYRAIQKERNELRAADEQALPESLKARRPGVPDPYDDAKIRRRYWMSEDDEDDEEDEEKEGEKPYEPFRPRRKRMHKNTTVPPRRPPLSQEIILPEDEPEDELPLLPDLRATPTFMGLPREVRMEIYRYLLTVKRPIAVHGGWQQVYWTKDLQLSTKILRVCKRVHEEASTMLYGSNTFLYRLRDATTNVWNIENLEMEDSLFLVDEEESSSEYEEDLEQDDEDEEDDPKESTINIDKYGHLFRNITIEAEANRYSTSTQDSMVAALNVFRKPDDGAPDEDAPYVKPRNIHTLTVRIMPTWDRQNDQLEQGRFTFVDFFIAGGPVINAIKAVDCQMLYVELQTRHSSRRSAHVTVSGTGSCRLAINRRHEQALAYFKENPSAGMGDKALRMRTVEMARRSMEAIDTLATHIQEQCNQRDFGQETAMNTDINSLDWLDLDEEDEDLDEEDEDFDEEDDDI